MTAKELNEKRERITSLYAWYNHGEIESIVCNNCYEKNLIADKNDYCPIGRKDLENIMYRLGWITCDSCLGETELINGKLIDAMDITDDVLEMEVQRLYMKYYYIRAWGYFANKPEQIIKKEIKEAEKQHMPEDVIYRYSKRHWAIISDIKNEDVRERIENIVNEMKTYDGLV